MTITALPTAPARSDPPATFITRADALMAALSTLVSEVNAATLAMNLNATNDTSASSVAIGTGAKSFTVSAGKSFLGGMYLVIADAAAPSTNWMMGQVTSYIGTALVMNILALGGSGTKTSWLISQSAIGVAGGGVVAGLSANSFTGVQKWAKGADVASAGALTLGTDGNYFDITGTTSVNSIGTLGVGTWARLHFDAALTLTHHATDLILPGAANIVTAAGDEAEFLEYAAGDWRCVSYLRAAEVPTVVLQATAEAGTDTAPRLWTAERVKQAIDALSGITLGTPQATTSGTSIDFTGIPAGTKMIVVSLQDVSTNGTSLPLIQLGDSGGVETSGYAGSILTTTLTDGFKFYTSWNSATVANGCVILTLLNASTNLWAAQTVMGITGATGYGGGTKALTGTLDRIRLTTVGGTDTFDAGAINIAYLG